MAAAMTSAKPAPSVTLPPRVYSPLGGLLSYLVPGLGQIYQGRVGKGLLFLVCLYGLFFYGLYLGEWQNVYLQPLKDPNARVVRDQSGVQMVLDRARFLGQVWIGVAAWPAIYQAWIYSSRADKREDEPPRSLFGKFQRMPTDQELNDFLRRSDKHPDLGWMYTVVAGVLNILVIYDAFAGPAFRAANPQPAAAAPEAAT
jgi:hypothetical protein